MGDEGGVVAVHHYFSDRKCVHFLYHSTNCVSSLLNNSQCRCMQKVDAGANEKLKIMALSQHTSVHCTYFRIIDFVNSAY